MRAEHDVVVVGAGLIGLAVARALTGDHPGLAAVVLDKEEHVATHQSGHNSGVVHSGLYYKPGSLKARLSVEGRRRVYELCEKAGIAFRRPGKLVIASDDSELPALEELHRRGVANGLVGMERLGPDGLREIEPAAVGVAGLRVPETGVADFPAMARHLADELAARGSEVRTGQDVIGIESTTDGVRVITPGSEITARSLINCAGLQCDRVARMAGVTTDLAIIPFRGEYYRLDDSAAGLVKTLIYPVPDPRFPFLGVHFTRRVDDMVEVGPNAVVALGREQYRGVSPDWGDTREIIGDTGFRRLAMKHWWSGTGELIRSRSRVLYARQARRLVPDVRAGHLIRAGAGVRAQAIGRDGELIDDFVIETAGNTVHVLNAPSPGATASLAIGSYIAGVAAPILSR